MEKKASPEVSLGPVCISLTDRIDLRKVKTYSIKERKSKVNVSHFAKVSKGKDFKEFLSSFPNILAGNDFKEIVKSIVRANSLKKPVIWAMGAHPIKCGLSPLIIDLMQKGVITALALQGAGVIHDVEITLFGETSENVEEGLKNGKFGMVKETNEFINKVISEEKGDSCGYGEIIGRNLSRVKSNYKKYSILAHAYQLNIPVCVFIAVGTDINFMHPNCDAGKIGTFSYNDFLKFCQILTKLGKGGVILNIGSAVILPEVILKALTVVKNLGYNIEGFVSCNFDFIQHYRSRQQIVHRVGKVGGYGYFLTCHHEILIPLLYRAILEYI